MPYDPDKRPRYDLSMESPISPGTKKSPTPIFTTSSSVTELEPYAKSFVAYVPSGVDPATLVFVPTESQSDTDGQMTIKLSPGTYPLPWTMRRFVSLSGSGAEIYPIVD